MSERPAVVRLLGHVVYWEPIHRMVWTLAYPLASGGRWRKWKVRRWPWNRLAHFVLRLTSDTPGIGKWTP